MHIDIYWHSISIFLFFKIETFNVTNMESIKLKY